MVENISITIKIKVRKVSNGHLFWQSSNQQSGLNTVCWLASSLSPLALALWGHHTDILTKNCGKVSTTPVLWAKQMTRVHADNWFEHWGHSRDTEWYSCSQNRRSIPIYQWWAVSKVIWLLTRRTVCWVWCVIKMCACGGPVTTSLSACLWKDRGFQ